jgi:hypothetical protein
MRCEIEDFKTGWFQIYLRLHPNEVDDLIRLLNGLKEDSHFHLANQHTEASGVADIEISLQGNDELDNMRLL